MFREEKVVSAQRWAMSPQGQHIELGIAENNLFLLLAALGLSAPLFGARLLPIGTLYDPFIKRGLDALNYACYQDARFILVATPSGITLAPEGGAHQSVVEPLIGIGQPGLSAFEPAFADELATILRWAFRAYPGGRGRLGLSPAVDAAGRAAATADDRGSGATGDRRRVLAARRRPTGPRLPSPIAGAVAPEAIEAHRQILDDIPGAGLLAVTSADRLHGGWRAAQGRGTGEPSAAETLLAPLRTMRRSSP